MKTVEIVTHAYAEVLPDYAGDLVYHLSSLVLHPPKCSYLMTICYSLADVCVSRIVDWFYGRLPIKKIHQPVAELGRRTIGRNLAAKNSEADLVWFADGDFAFGNGCLDTLADIKWPQCTLAFPRTVLINPDHRTGDDMVKQLSNRIELFDVDASKFTPIVYTFAIGGLQIVQGDFAREWGYLGTPEYVKWHQPTKTPFSDTLEDAKFRKYCLEHGIGSKPIELPNLYRLRQTVNARM